MKNKMVYCVCFLQENAGRLFAIKWRNNMRADKNTQPSGSAARRILKGFGKVFGTMVLVLFLTTLIFACLFALYVKNNLSAQVDSIDGFTLDQTSVIYYEDPKTGQDVVLRKLYGGANRTWVKYEDIPKNLIHACIAIEDKRFEDHQGVDWVTTLKACVKMFLGRGEAGGSTITQQLVKNITGRDEVTVRRKLVEIFSALELEKKYTKKQIMELYLNVIALGENCEGVESASQVYFGKSVSELDLARVRPRSSALRTTPRSTTRISTPTRTRSGRSHSRPDARAEVYHAGAARHGRRGGAGAP